MKRFTLAAAIAVGTLAVGATPVSAVDSPTCQGEPATIVAGGGVTTGTDGPDVIVGTTGADTINALDATTSSAVHQTVRRSTDPTRSTRATETTSSSECSAMT